ncbi:MAG: F0F1 ATP synthase subunit B [Candidatus Liberibacter ctenarytainae]|uniref:ATP synthase subunit b n=1 Tax=Candidatus Liberibacter ctenarytainae TaxID=2020335 RepID=A0A937AKK2_9HYPH|nr:F0F1 ATP synthase subunit B [Candidatus Liberibacter ctenarytainae]
MPFDETFLVFIALVIFIAILLFFRIPSLLRSFLDARADGIRNELFEARRAREEAENLLEQYKEKYSKVENEVRQIIIDAENKVSLLEEENRKRIAEAFDLRHADLEKKINLMELEYMRSFYIKLADFSIEFSQKIISEKMSDDVVSRIFQEEINNLKSRHINIIHR